MLRLIYPSVPLAFPVIRSMWEFQVRPLDMSTPKYLALVTTSSTWPCKVYTDLITSLAVVTRTTWRGWTPCPTGSPTQKVCQCLFVALSHLRSLQLLGTRPCHQQIGALVMTTLLGGHLCIQGTESVPRPTPGERQRSPGPILIPRLQGQQSATGYRERPESRKVHYPWSHTDGVSRGALSDLLYQKPLKSPAVSDQFVCLHLCS